MMSAAARASTLAVCVAAASLLALAALLPQAAALSLPFDDPGEACTAPNCLSCRQTGFQVVLYQLHNDHVAGECCQTCEETFPVDEGWGTCTSVTQGATCYGPNGAECREQACFCSKLGQVNECTACQTGYKVYDGTCVPICGDGVVDVDEGEECDDGNDSNNDQCLNTCRLATCSDGYVGPGETCDEGPNNDDGGACTTACQTAYCGDGYVQLGSEQCDLGVNNSDTGACLRSCTLNVCGDGFRGPAEECDYGRANGGSSLCTPGCKINICGDSVVRSGVEACDEGAANGLPGVDCTTTCTLPSCGDGTRDLARGEACDPGIPEDAAAGCNPHCQYPRCGDGFLDTAAGEECDTGSALHDEAECTTSCEKARCGDGFQQLGEECDLGAANLDGGPCSTQCKLARCGDGLVQAGEQCDLGTQNRDSGACSSACVAGVCGDGILQAVMGEECDNGSDNGANKECTGECKVARCGDGHTWFGHEQCDDANQDDTDSCLNTCTFATCGDGRVRVGVEECDNAAFNDDMGILSQCTRSCQVPKCGDAIVQAGESCDDGNPASGDGCSDSCDIELGFDCPSHGGGCANIDLCADNNGGCDPLTTCTDRTAGRDCGNCPYPMSGSGYTGCIDEPLSGLVITEADGNGRVYREFGRNVHDTTNITATIVTGSRPEFEWEFGGFGDGDERFYGQAMRIPEYTAPGAYVVRVQVSNNFNTIALTFTLVVVPRIEDHNVLAVVPSHVVQGAEVTFDGALLPAAAGWEATMEWVLDTEDSSPTEDMTTSVTQLGVRTYTLTADNGLSRGVATGVFEVVQAVRGAAIAIASGDTVQAARAVTFAAVITAGTDVRYTWELEDGLVRASGTTVTFVYPTPGTVTVRLVAQNAVSRVVVATQFEVVPNAWAAAIVPIGDPAVVFDPTFVVRKSRMQVTSNGLSAGASVQWTWEPGMSRTLPIASDLTEITQEVSYAFAGPGLHLVTAVITLADGSSFTAEGMMVVDNPIVRVAGSPSGPVTLGADTAFAVALQPAPADTMVVCEWDFGDGSDPAVDPECDGEPHRFTASGTFVVTVSAANSLQSEESKLTVIVDVPPTGLALAVSPSPTPLNGLTTMAAAADRGTHMVWSFAFGDGLFASNEGPTVTHTYLQSGSYTVEATASSAHGSQVVRRTVVVQDTIAGLRMICPQSVVLGTDGVFSYEVDSGDNMQALWDFKDATSRVSTLGAVVSHTFNTAGAFEVSLVLRNAIGKVSGTCTVPVASAITSLSLGAVSGVFLGVETEFAVAAHTGTGVSFLWEWEDGTEPLTTGELTARHTFARPGTYRIKVTASNALEPRVSETLAVEVDEPFTGVAVLPLADDQSTINLRAGGALVLTADITGGTRLGVQWTLPSPYPPQMDARMVQVFEKAGTFTVSLDVTNAVSPLYHREITVVVAREVPDFTVEVPSAAIENTISTFTAVVETLDDLTFHWTWGDNTEDSTTVTEVGEHVYTAPGTYTITVVASNGVHTATASVSVLVGVEYTITFLRVVAPPAGLDTVNVVVKLLGKDTESENTPVSTAAGRLPADGEPISFAAAEIPDVIRMELRLDASRTTYVFDKVVLTRVATRQEYIFFFSGELTVASVSLKPSQQANFRVISAHFDHVDITTRMQSIAIDTGSVGLALPAGDKTGLLRITSTELEQVMSTSSATVSVEYSFGGTTYSRTFPHLLPITIPTSRELSDELGVGRVRVRVRTSNPADAHGITLRAFAQRRDGSLTRELGEVRTDLHGYGFADLTSTVSSDLETLFLVPLATEMEGSTAPVRSFAEGPGVEAGAPGRSTEFIINAVDQFGNLRTSGGDDFQVIVASSTDVFGAVVQDTGRGKYLVSYTLPPDFGAAGLDDIFLVSVTLRDVHVADSPFVVSLNATLAAEVALADRPSAESAPASMTATRQFEDTVAADRWDGSGFSFTVDVHHHVTFVRDRGTAYQLQVPESLVPHLIRDTTHKSPGPFPDAKDMENSPASYGEAELDPEGGSGALSLATHFSSQEFKFNHIVLLETPALGEVCEGCTMQADVARSAVGNSIPFSVGGNVNNRVLIAKEAVVGKANLYTMKWMPMGHSLGDILYSMSLAPGEDTQIVAIESKIAQTGSTSNKREETQKLDSTMLRQRDIQEAASAVVNEVSSENSEASERVKSSQSTNTKNSQVQGGFLGIAAGNSASSSSSSSASASGSSSFEAARAGSKDMVGSTGQNLQDNVKQSSSSVRAVKSLVVTEQAQTENLNIFSKRIVNHNPHHALTVEYYEVLKHYRIRTEFTGAVDVILVPYNVPWYLLRDFPRRPPADGERLVRSARLALRWLEKHALPLLDEIVDVPVVLDDVRMIMRGEEGVARRDLVTAVTVTMQPSYNSNVRMHLRRHDGLPGARTSMLVALADVPGDQQSNQFLQMQFTLSVPIALADIGRLVVENGNDDKITRFRVVAFAGTASSSERVTLVEMDGEMGGNDRREFTINYDNTERRSRKFIDAWRNINRVMNFIQSDPIAACSHVWEAEQPDRRALRFQGLKFGGKPLLSIIQNEIVSIVGNLVAFPLLEDGLLQRPDDNPRLIAEDFVSLPTRGVFAETRLSRYAGSAAVNASLKVDYEFLELNKDGIASVGTGSRGTTALNTRANTFQQPVIYQQTAQAAPAPTSSAESIIGSLSSFSDMSHLAKGMASLSDSINTAVTTDAAKTAVLADLQNSNLEKLTELQNAQTKAIGDVALAAMGEDTQPDEPEDGGDGPGGEVASNSAEGLATQVSALDNMKEQGLIDEDTHAKEVHRVVTGSDPEVDAAQNRLSGKTPTTKAPEPAPQPKGAPAKPSTSGSEQQQTQLKKKAATATKRKSKRAPAKRPPWKP